jgi:uncharacterized protein (TIGR02246 family)
VSTPQEAVIDRLVEAYNAQDVEALAACFAEGAQIHRYPGVLLQDGREAIRADYAKLFADAPENRNEVVQRIVVGAHVADQSRLRRTPEATPTDLLTIYTVENKLIVRVDYLSAEQAG